MNDKEYRAKLIEWDKKSLDKRVERWKQLIPANYDVPLPELVWSYLSEADDLFIRGHFLSVIVLSASIVELVLADQIKLKTRMAIKEVERFGLEQLSILGHRLGILDDKETSQLNELRRQRNWLIHGNVGRLTQMAKKRYRISGGDDSFLDAEFYVQSGFEGGIDQDARLHLRLVRDLTVNFYGPKP